MPGHKGAWACDAWACGVTVWLRAWFKHKTSALRVLGTRSRFTLRTSHLGDKWSDNNAMNKNFLGSENNVWCFIDISPFSNFSNFLLKTYERKIRKIEERLATGLSIYSTDYIDIQYRLSIYSDH